ncbi:hypothetical protein HYV43_06220 [Candidatus Micrarchaeota archaeon]|nr:hypothetical protein [Candidatus Micrarchaeota archaeon]
MFEAEIRQVGTSLGVLIPAKIVRQKHWKKGTRVFVTFLDIDEKAIKKGFGMGKGMKPYQKVKWSKWE